MTTQACLYPSIFLIYMFSQGLCFRESEKNIWQKVWRRRLVMTRLCFSESQVLELKKLTETLFGVCKNVGLNESAYLQGQHWLLMDGGVWLFCSLVSFVHHVLWPPNPNALHKVTVGIIDTFKCTNVSNAAFVDEVTPATCLELFLSYHHYYLT